MTKVRVYLGLTVAAAFAAGAVAEYLATQKPKSFAECLLINARDAHTEDGVSAVGQACSELYPDSAKTFGQTSDPARSHVSGDAKQAN